MEYFEKSVVLRDEIKDISGLAQSYNNLALLLYEGKDYYKAIEFGEKALSYGQQALKPNSEVLAAKTLFMAYDKVNDMANTVRMSRIFHTLKDSVMSMDRIRYSTQLELQYQYEKERKDKEFEHQLLQTEKELQTLIFIIVSTCLIFLCLIFILLYNNQRIKNKQNKLLQEKLTLESENLNLEKKNLQLENLQLEQSVEFKNKELTTHVMYLLQKNELNKSVVDRLIAQKKELEPTTNTAWIDSIVSDIGSNVDNSVWNEFEVRFQQVHEDFYQKLSEQYPDLTLNEKRLSAFLRLNMSSKDISSITSQSIKSLEIARSRLRKKLGLNRSESLSSFFQQL